MNRVNSRVRDDGAEHGLRHAREVARAVAGERLSLAGTRRPREHPMRNRPAPSLPSRSAALLLLASLAAGGCVRQLAVQDEYFAPASGSSARSRVAALHLVSHHRALQAAQRSCVASPIDNDAPPLEAQSPDGPELGSAAAREALRRLCASIPPQLPVAAHGATSNAYRRWVEDNVRQLPEASQTAASAAGGS